MFAIAVTLIALLAFNVVHRRYFHPLSRYPGPFLASVTDLWQVYRKSDVRMILIRLNRRFWVCFIVGDHHLSDKKMHDVYGPIVRIGPNTISFSEASAAQAIYGYNKAMVKGVFYSCFGDPKPENANMFQTRTAERHHEIRRKMVSGALVPSRTAAYEPIVTRTVSIFLHQLHQSQKTSKMMVNMAPRVHLFAMDTFFEMSHGTSLNFQTLGYDGHGGAAAEQRYLTKSGFRISLLPWLATLLQPISYIQMVRKATFDKNGKARGFYAIIDASKKAQANAPLDAPSMEPCILKNLIEIDPQDDRRMDGIELWRELFNASMAGTGSISACLTMILYHLGMHPDWQSRILEEVENQISQPNSNTSLHSVSYLTLANCSSLNAVIKESLRISPPFPSSFPRDIAPGAENAIPGLPAPLPLGTTVQANVYVIGHSREFWGDDADEWRPSRWSEGEKRLEDGYLIFGRGHRACVGRGISYMALSKMVYALVSRWEMKTLPESLKGRNYFEMQYEQLLVELRPRKDKVVF